MEKGHNKKLWDNVWEGSKLFFPHFVLIDKINKLKGIKKIIEFGAGTGSDVLELAKDDYQVTYSDFSEVAISKFKKKIEDLKIKNISIEKADVLSIKHAKNTFDLVYSCGLIEHFEEAERLEILKNMITISNKYVIVDFPNKLSLHNVAKKILMFLKKRPYGWETEFSYWEFKKYLLANFANIEVVDFYGRELLPIPRKIKQKFRFFDVPFGLFNYFKGSIGIIIRKK